MGSERQAMTGKQCKSVIEDSRYVYPPKYRDRCCIIQLYSSLLTLADLWGVLSEAEKVLIRTTAIGHLMDIPEEHKWSAAIFCFLMSRQIHVQPERRWHDEMWLVVGDEEFCFGKADFSLISGLRFRNLSDRDFDSDPLSVDGKNRLEEVAKKTNSQKFKPRRTIYQDVEPRPCEAEVRVKVALLYVVHMFLLGNQDTLQIEADTWHLVDNLSLFNKFPWAERVYKATIEKSDTAFKSQIKTESEKEKKTQMSSDDMPTVKPKGMPHVLVVWFLMLFPGVLRDWGIKKNVERWRPHMIDVLCLKKVHHAQLCASVEQSVFSEDMMMRHRNDSELLVILGAAKGPLNLKQLEDLETECMLGKQWEAMMGDTRLLIPEESTGNTISVEIVTSPTRRQGKSQATEARNNEEKGSEGWSVENSHDDVVEENITAGVEIPAKKGKKKVDQLLNAFRDSQQSTSDKFDELYLQNRIIMQQIQQMQRGMLLTTGPPPEKEYAEDVAFSASVPTDFLEYCHQLGDDVGVRDGNNGLETCFATSSGTDPGDETLTTLLSEFQRMKKRKCDERQLPDQANEIYAKARKRNLGVIVKSPAATHRMHNRVGNGDESVPKKVRLLKELDPVELGPSESDERCAKKPKRLSKGKTSKDKKNFFFNFRTNLQITKQDTNAINYFINQGGDGTVGSLLNCADFTTLLEPEGVLGTNHINNMLFLMRESSSLCHGGSWTTIDTHFEQFLQGKSNNKKLEQYRKGELPKGGARPWKYVCVVYGVVHIVDISHWVAIRIKLKENEIAIYDSMRPRPNTSSDRVYKEIKVIRDYLENKAGKGEWEVEFDESCPQQDKKSTSCGVYALKFVEHLIRGIHLSEIKKSKILQYRREMAVQFYKKQFLEVNILSGE